MVMLVLADEILDKFGCDSLAETRDNLERYRDRIAITVADSRSAAGSDLAGGEVGSGGDD